MTLDKHTTNPEPEEDIDDPYIHTVSTEEFVETAERASRTENDDQLSPNED